MIKISVGRITEKKKFLSRFKVELPNGDQVILLTLGGPLVCEIEEDDRNRFITGLAKNLGEYSYLKEEVMIILSNLKHLTKLRKIYILTHILDIISLKLKIEGKKKRDILKIRNELFDVLNLHGYSVGVFPTKMDIRESFTVDNRVSEFL